MSIFDMFSKRNSIEQSMKEMNMKNDSVSILHRSEYEDYDGSTTGDYSGPYNSEWKDGRFIMPTIKYRSSLKAFLEALTWITENQRSHKEFVDWYKNNINKYIVEICNCPLELIRKKAEILRTNYKDIREVFIGIAKDCQVNNIEMEELFFICLSIDIYTGCIPDIHNLYAEYYESNLCRNIVNSFPIHSTRKTKNDRSINVNVAYYICYNSLYDFRNIFKHEILDRYWQNVYYEYMSVLSYANIDTLNAEQAMKLAGLSLKFIDKTESSRCREIIYQNKGAIKVVRFIKYIAVNKCRIIDRCIEVNGYVYYSKNINGVNKSGTNFKMNMQFGYDGYKLQVER